MNLILLFDIDGVIRNWSDSARRVLTNVGYDLLPTEQWKWNIDTWLKEPLPEGEIEELVYDKLAYDVYVGADAYDEARQTLSDFYCDGHEVWLVSNQFTSKLQDLTDEWLDDNNIRYTGKIYTANKKYVNGHIFIDDKPENVISMVHSVGKSLLFNRPWNEQSPILPSSRVYDWEEIKNLVNFTFRGMM